ncbi:MAG: aldo/keto reductase [Pseudomonadota bacterium]
MFDYSRDGVLRAFEQSLLRLGLDRIDVLLIHDVDVWTHGPDAIESRFREAMDGAYRALADLRAQGVIKAIGIGVNEAEMCARFARAGDFDVMLLPGAIRCSSNRRSRAFCRLRSRSGSAVMLGGVFNSGRIGDRRGAGRALQLSPGAARAVGAGRAYRGGVPRP